MIRNEIKQKLENEMNEIIRDLKKKYSDNAQIIKFILPNNLDISIHTENTLETKNIYGFMIIAIQKNNHCEIIYKSYENNCGEIGEEIHDYVTYGFKKCNKIITKNNNIDIEICINKDNQIIFKIGIIDKSRRRDGSQSLFLSGNLCINEDDPDCTGNSLSLDL